MKKLQKMTALLLCFLMMFPSQGMAALTEPKVVQVETATESNAMERIEETVELEPIVDRINEMLPLEPIGEGSVPVGEPAIYWNPGGVLQSELATPSDARTIPSDATSSNAAAGSDRAYGLTPEDPVKTLEAALERAEELQQEQGFDRSEITIYAMNPMEIGDGQMYVLNAGNVRIASWPGRANGNDTIFYLTGGQLTLANTILESGKADYDPESAELVRIHGGALQLGRDVEIRGCSVLDYREKTEDMESETATGSNASPSDASINRSGEAEDFDINDYILNTEPDAWEVVRDHTSASTWKAPVIELTDGFEGADGAYLLKIYGDNRTTRVQAVKTLYADGGSDEEFMGAFRLAETSDQEWDLTVAVEMAANIRDTGAEDLARYLSGSEVPDTEPETEEMTVKCLMATRGSSGLIKYWNPGGAISVSDKVYSAGNDKSHDGNTAGAAYKTLEFAVENAKGGTVICMQTVTLGPEARDYLGAPEDDGSYLVKSSSDTTIVTLKAWESSPVPVFRVPAEEKLALQDIVLEGIDKEAEAASTQMVICEGGDIVIRENVTADTGFIQVNAWEELKDHPVQVTSLNGGMITLFFGGINKDLSYRYTDVVVPGGDLTTQAATDADAVGKGLMNRFQLEISNHAEESGGNSDFDWKLRQDTVEDDEEANPENLELYADYYFDAIYLDGERGADTNFGATCQYPVATWERAKSIWTSEMERSIEARKAEWAKNPDKERLDLLFPLPKTIYVCGTVTVKDTQQWELKKLIDCDGNEVETEVVSHTEIPDQEGGSGKVHQSPKSLVQVDKTGKLTLNNVLFRNVTDLPDSNTVEVLGGGKLTMTGTATMTGKRSGKATRGTHVQLRPGAAFTMNNGVLEWRQQGVVANGADTNVEMNGGEIRKNNSYDETESHANQKKGTGVVLTGGASFNMNGGTIAENQVYQYGAGVYLDGSGTSFHMNRGVITANKMAMVTKVGSTNELLGSGIGVYAGAGTDVQIGTPKDTADGKPEDTVISRNEGYWVYGSGAYTAGTWTMQNAELSGNTCYASKRTGHSDNISQGIGLYVAATGMLQVEDSIISGNQTSKSAWGYDDVNGVGIYLEESEKNNYIKKSKISGNRAGNSDKRGGGGGIYSAGKLLIEDSVIENNRAYQGAGILVSGTASVLEMKNSTICSNIATTSASSEENPAEDGLGGGIHADESSRMVINGNMKISDNAASNGGGVYLEEAAKIQLLGTETKNIRITNNRAAVSGGGLYNKAGTVSGTQVIISNNESSLSGGGITSSGNSWFYLSDVKVVDNQAKTGGGIAFEGGTVYWSETSKGKSSLRGNTASEKGGGIYKFETGNLYLDFDNDIQNNADEQGSNIYAEQSDMYLLQGRLLQPKTPVEGVYNVYISNDSAASLQIDPTKVKVEAKEGTNPDAIYLNTGNSFLTYLETPSINTKTMPIDLNTDVFKIGSVVIKPADKVEIEIKIPKKDITITGTDSYYKIYSGLKDATKNIGYASGGILPRRSQLGGYQDSNNSSLMNVVVVGEGVYLASENFSGDVNLGGDDEKNGGTSPQDAVATFGQAKELLKKRIEDANVDPHDSDGFAPYIYICGNVLIDEDETWELIYDDELFITTNADYIKAEIEAGEKEESYRTQVRRFTSFVKQPMITVDKNEQRKVTFTTGKIIINGMAEGVVTDDQYNHSPVILVQQEAEVHLTGDSQIVNNYYQGIDLFGKLTMNGEETDRNEQIKNIGGTAVRMLGEAASVEMAGFSTILTDHVVVSLKERYGIEGLPQSVGSSVLMKEDSKIDGGNIFPMKTGIYLRAPESSVVMQGSAQIIGGAGGTGITLGNESCAEMRGSAKISGGAIGVNLNDSGSLLMNRNQDQDEKPDDFAQITGSTSGITVSGAGSRVEMGKKSSVNNNKSGIVVEMSENAEEDEIVILMMDDSKINGNVDTGISFGKMKATPIKLHMLGDAMVAGNGDSGIFAKNVNYGVEKLMIVMEDDTRIGGNGGRGINIEAQIDGKDASSYHKIAMSGQAQIGGIKNYNENDMSTGNKKAGIYVVSPTNLTMTDEASIQYNGSNPRGSNFGTGGGIFMDRKPDDNSAIGSITMSGKSTISNNKGSSIFVSTEKAERNPWDITIKDASLQGNTDSLFIGDPDSILRLEGQVSISESTYIPSSQEDVRSIDCYGKLELDGESTVDGRIWMRTGNNPITMTGKVKSPKAYHLWLGEGFLGQIVVQPNDPDGTNDGITDVTDQMPYFIKDGADGLAAPKVLMAAAPNIILEGENHVYLSGEGDDKNSGNSPGTAVRTFQRARELLRSGYFRKGANILICSEVDIQEGDTDWSFDAGGTVTNDLTGDIWKPLVKRYKESEPCKLLDVTLSDTVTFAHITIDGGAEEGIYSDRTRDVTMLTMGEKSGTVILGEGAVLQNNRNDSKDPSNNKSVGVNVEGGTLIIDGGTIRGMTRNYKDSGPYTGLAAAIRCSSDDAASVPKVVFRSGLITDNTLSYTGGGQSQTIGAAVSIEGYAVLEMSGGIISDNEHSGEEIGTDSQLAGGAAIYVEDGTAEISGGIIRNNKAARGSAIYYKKGNGSAVGSVILSGGQIYDNTGNSEVHLQAVGSYAPIYIADGDFQLKGGGCNISDPLYLDSTEHLVTVSGNIYQKGRLYQVYLNQGGGADQFRKGSVVVQPDGNWMKDVSAYLPYFQVNANPYVLDRGQTTRPGGTVIGMVENQCLLLMQAVYLDSVDGDDSRDGTTPETAVKTFTQAKTLGQSGIGGPEDQEYYIIYVSGKAVNTKAETEWTMAVPAYMCRYTGFKVYQDDGSEADDSHYYYGYLIEPAYDLTLKNITVYGRRGIDTISSNGESLVKINQDITVTVQTEDEGNTIFGRNYNRGEYMGEDDIQASLSGEGGAFYVAAEGVLELKGGSVLDSEAAYGSAVYLATDKEDPAKVGHLKLSNSPSIAGKVHLSGDGIVTGAYVEAVESYVPKSPLQISINNDYNGREVVRYIDGAVPGYDQLKYYQFDDSIQAIYEIVNREDAKATLELSQRKTLYIDGQNGSDGEDGLTPETAYRTLEQVYRSIGNADDDQKGIVVYIVDTLKFPDSDRTDVVLNNILVKNDDGTSHHQGSYDDNLLDEPISIRGQVYFKRYAQPSGYTENDQEYKGFGKPTFTGPLFDVETGGKLTLSGMYVDGHSQKSIGSDPKLIADGVNATAPLIVVREGGELDCSPMNEETVANGIITSTLLVNNHNIRQKNDVIGTLDGSEIIEGSSSGIELLKGKVTLSRTEFRNLTLGEEVVSGGTDVYSNGELHVSDKTLFSGTVFLEGFGTKEDSQETSRYLTIDKYGEPTSNDFQVLMRDPYVGRKVVHYKPEDADENGPEANQEARFRLEERVKEFFYLGRRAGDHNIFELTVPVGVYIDGVNGDDNLNNSGAGSNPENPVRTLARAFQLLRTRAGGTIHVVNTVDVNVDTQITGTMYQGTEVITLGSTDKVNFVRYIQPDFVKEAAGDTEYDVEDFTGPMMKITDGVMLTLGRNVFVDGHSEVWVDDKYPQEIVVNHPSESKAPLIRVEPNAILELLAGAELRNNDNSYEEQTDSTGIHGGALSNSGTVTVDGVLFTNNKAAKGSAVYQDGIFTIQSSPENIGEHTFYLTTDNKGSDHIIQTAAAMPEAPKLIYTVDMDNAVKGRDVIRFVDPSAYDPNADAEYNHFTFGSTVPKDLFLVQAKEDEEVLELQNWEVLDVEVPSDIYLIVQGKGTADKSAELLAIRDDAEGTDLMSAPNYAIKNHGLYEVKVSVSSFDNLNEAAGILHDKMSLTESPLAAADETDIYLALKGLDEDETNGFAMTETSLMGYSGNTEPEPEPLLMGNLKANGVGHFTFKGSVGEGFVNKYMDSTFPIDGETRKEAQAYMDGTSGTGIHARAKYALRYKVEIASPRR